MLVRIKEILKLYFWAQGYFVNFVWNKNKNKSSLFEERVI